MQFIYNVNKLSTGYIYDFLHLAYGQIGVGGLGSVALLPKSLDSVYGKTPVSFMVFLRAKLGSDHEKSHGMEGMKM